jgi:hypothetical protein
MNEHKSSKAAHSMTLVLNQYITEKWNIIINSSYIGSNIEMSQELMLTFRTEGGPCLFKLKKYTTLTLILLYVISLTEHYSYLL